MDDLTDLNDFNVRPYRGGCFVETNEIGGWYFGDTTKHFEIVEPSEILEKTGLDLDIVYDKNDEGENIVTVTAKNAISVSEMLLAKNTDVGDQIKYAEHHGNINTGHTIDPLTAKMGEHIIIQPMENKDYIRAIVYPRYMV